MNQINIRDKYGVELHVKIFNSELAEVTLRMSNSFLCFYATTEAIKAIRDIMLSVPRGTADAGTSWHWFNNDYVQIDFGNGENVVLHKAVIKQISDTVGKDEAQTRTLSDDCRYSLVSPDEVKLDLGKAGNIILKKTHVETLYKLFHAFDPAPTDRIDSLFDVPAIRKQADEVQEILQNLKNFFK